MPKSLTEYLNTLEEGDKVIDTGHSAQYGLEGVVGPNGDTVLWNPLPGSTVKMTTSVTAGTRRIEDMFDEDLTILRNHIAKNIEHCKAADRLVEIAEAGGLASYDLDDLVHDLASRFATSINNMDMQAQIDYIVNQLGEKEAEQKIRGLV